MTDDSRVILQALAEFARLRPEEEPYDIGDLIVRARMALDRMSAEVIELQARLEASDRLSEERRAMLEEHQWDARDGFNCVECLAFRGWGHEADCKIARLVQ